jgi:hypothetical protein
VSLAIKSCTAVQKKKFIVQKAQALRQRPVKIIFRCDSGHLNEEVQSHFVNYPTHTNLAHEACFSIKFTINQTTVQRSGIEQEAIDSEVEPALYVLRTF